jgi:hypothetical protein
MKNGKYDQTGDDVTEKQAIRDIILMRRIQRETDSYSRIGTIQSVAPVMSKYYWFKMLGELWGNCDNIAKHQHELLDQSPLADTDEPILVMMNDEEQEIFAELPDVFDLYRGCYEGINEDGFSFSVDKDIAKEFPTLNRYRRTDSRPLLIHGRVNKNNIIAFKNDRDEEEVIVRGDCVNVVERVFLDL